MYFYEAVDRTNRILWGLDKCPDGVRSEVLDILDRLKEKIGKTFSDMRFLASQFFLLTTTLSRALFYPKPEYYQKWREFFDKLPDELKEPIEIYFWDNLTGYRHVHYDFPTYNLKPGDIISYAIKGKPPIKSKIAKINKDFSFYRNRFVIENTVIQLLADKSGASAVSHMHGQLLLCPDEFVVIGLRELIK